MTTNKKNEFSKEFDVILHIFFFEEAIFRNKNNSAIIYGGSPFPAIFIIDAAWNIHEIITNPNRYLADLVSKKTAINKKQTPKAVIFLNLHYINKILISYYLKSI